MSSVKKLISTLLSSLIELARLLIRFLFKERELLTSDEPSKIWQYFNLSIAEGMTYIRNKKPQFFSIIGKLTLVFSLLITLSLMSLAFLIYQQQQQWQQQQTLALAKSVASQAAYSLKTPLLITDKAEVKTIVNNLLFTPNLLAVHVYDSHFTPVFDDGQPAPNLVFPTAEQEFVQTYTVVNTELFAEESLLTYTLSIKQNALVVGYVTLVFGNAGMDNLKLEILQNLAVLILSALCVCGLTSFYLSKLITKPLYDLLNFNPALNQNATTQYKDKRKDEVSALMQAMNAMHQGLVAKDKVEAVFSRYVSAQVAAQVLKDLDSMEGVELGGEHVMASVFFADIVGFTSLSETLEPQEISELLNIYFSKIIQAVNFCNGHVDKFIGDCAMVVFGVPTKTPQHGFYCVACAWMILQLVEALNEQREVAGEVTVEFRIGANSGMMLAGNMGSKERMEYTVVGDSVNLASRLSGSAEPGELVITEDVFIEQGLEDSVFAEVKDLIKIRGKKLPVKILNVKDILTPFKQRMLNEIPKIIASTETSPIQPKIK